MAYTADDLFDILNEDGTRSGLTKPRALVHRDGDLHGASHVFLTRLHEGRIEVLLQKRSMTKDSFPGCLDISSAGHLDAGEAYDDAARRELSEELGIQNQMPQFLFIQRQDYEASFYGSYFHDREIDYVYMLELDLPAEAFKIEEAELQSVHWMAAAEVLNAVDAGNPRFCLLREEFHRLVTHLEAYFHQKVV